MTAEWKEYIDVLREDAHQLLAWGYADARKLLRSARDEYDITDFLSSAMDNRINDPQTPEHFMNYVVRPEHPVSPNAMRGKDRPKLDVQIVRTGRPQRYFTFEAKRLRDDAKASVADSVNHYLGNQGVGRFVAGFYGKESVEAAMIGCIQAHDGGFWINEIGKRFLDDVSSGRNSLCILEQFQACEIISTLEHEMKSSHSRIELVPITLYHIFLECM